MLYAKIRKKKTIPSNVEKKWSYENNTSKKIILNKQNYGIVTIVIISIILSVTLKKAIIRYFTKKQVTAF